MKILVLTGSPHKKGTSALLADRFCQGAEEKGHTITRKDLAFLSLHPCMACNYCRSHEGACVQQDDMQQIFPLLLEADMVVFVTPLYYFGMSAQLKMAIDRFYAINDQLQAHPKKAILLATCGDTDSWAMDGLHLHYQTICRYLGWQDVGYLPAFGMYVRSDIESSDYPQKAYELGLSLE
jgi:multimeric flavodoxin WrbA